MNVKEWKDVSRGKPSFTLKGQSKPIFDVSSVGDLRLQYCPVIPEAEVPRFVRWLAEVYEMQAIFEKELECKNDLSKK